MLEAVTYQGMLKHISDNQIKDDIIGILITRPDLETGSSILNGLNYYHHATKEKINFYLPGYGAYWYGSYPDGRVVSKINGTDWSYSDQMFAAFIEKLEEYSKWKYSGESELLILRYEEGILSFEHVIRFYLDNMLRDGVIDSVPCFFQQLFTIWKADNSIDRISNISKGRKLFSLIEKALLDNIPSFLGRVFTQERHFCVRDYRRKMEKKM